MTSSTAEAAAIEARYREYCDACQSGHLEKLKDFWHLPATFAIDFGKPDTVQIPITTYRELEQLYGTQFGSSTGVDTTKIDSSEVHFFGDKLATIETQLRHLSKGKLANRQHASYGCRKIDGQWWFISHISDVVTESE